VKQWEILKQKNLLTVNIFNQNQYLIVAKKQIDVIEIFTPIGSIVKLICSIFMFHLLEVAIKMKK
jgi:hypothetical protein